MPAQAVIFDLSVFPSVADGGTASIFPAGSDAARLFHETIEHGLPCALISELPYREAEQELRIRFGDTAHHIFSVVITGADFAERGHRGAYSVALNQLGMSPDEVVAVVASPHAIAAARGARIDIRGIQDAHPEARPGVLHSTPGEASVRAHH